MPASPAELLHEWHDFYILLGTASATLVGLMFVAVSIGTSVFNEEHRAPMRAFITPTVMHFAAVLFACVVVTIPTHSWWTRRPHRDRGARRRDLLREHIGRHHHPAPVQRGFERPAVLRAPAASRISARIDLRGAAVLAVGGERQPDRRGAVDVAFRRPPQCLG